MRPMVGPDGNLVFPSVLPPPYGLKKRPPVPGPMTPEERLADSRRKLAELAMVASQSQTTPAYLAQLNERLNRAGALIGRKPVDINPFGSPEPDPRYLGPARDYSLRQINPRRPTRVPLRNMADNPLIALLMRRFGNRELPPQLQAFLARWSGGGANPGQYV